MRSIRCLHAHVLHERRWVDVGVVGVGGDCELIGGGEGHEALKGPREVTAYPLVISHYTYMIQKEN